MRKDGDWGDVERRCVYIFSHERHVGMFSSAGQDLIVQERSTLDESEISVIDREACRFEGFSSVQSLSRVQLFVTP